MERTAWSVYCKGQRPCRVKNTLPVIIVHYFTGIFLHVADLAVQLLDAGGHIFGKGKERVIG